MMLDVICPSLPGYGFSESPLQRVGVWKIATVWNELMIRFGYERYFAQGGDWGSAVATTAIGLQDLGQCAMLMPHMPNAGVPKEALLNPTGGDISHPCRR